MSILAGIKAFFGGRTPPEPQAPSMDGERFIYLRIPGNIQPIERGELFEDRIDPMLAQHNLGAVSGGGSFLGDPLADGTPVVDSCGIDIDVVDRDRALLLLRDLLSELAAPSGTQLHYTRDGARLKDVLTPTGWQCDQARCDLHPGFGI